MRVSLDSMMKRRGFSSLLAMSHPLQPFLDLGSMIDDIVSAGLDPLTRQGLPTSCLSALRGVLFTLLSSRFTGADLQSFPKRQVSGAKATWYSNGTKRAFTSLRPYATVMLEP